MASVNRRFVQFPHPGREHSPDYGDWKEWNPTRKPNGCDNSHGRKFLEIDGACVGSMDLEQAEKGKLWAWAEWEPESRVLRRFPADEAEMPHYLWEPVWQPRRDYRGLHNTDPFIFDGFYYTNCKQGSLPGLRKLGRGSVIVFGSMKKPYWVVDTVLVVADYVDHIAQDYKQLLLQRAPQSLWHATLSEYDNAKSSLDLRFYQGATHDAPTNGMFSFFPCLPAEQSSPFPRPHIELPTGYFNPNLSQGAKGCAIGAGPVAKSTVRELWHSVAEQVLDQGLRLGVWAQSPGSGVPPSTS